MFAVAWITPMRRTDELAGSVSAHSCMPVIHAGTEAARPIPISRSAARSDLRPPSQSSSTALVQVPIGTSVSRGCSA